MPPKTVIVYILAVLAAILMQMQRFTQETDNRTVEMVLDLSAASEYARSSAQKLTDFVEATYHCRGVDSLALPEQKFEDLEAHGVAGLFSAIQLAAMGPELVVDFGKSYVVVFQPEQADAVEAELRLAVGPEFVKNNRIKRWPALASKGAKDRVIIEIDLPVKALQNVGLGYSLRQVEPWRKSYRLWLRPENRPYTDETTVAAVLNNCAQIPRVQGLIFGGPSNEALGFPNMLNTTIDAVRDKNWKIGLIELPRTAQQKGIESLARGILDHTVRVFAVPPLQQATLRPERLAQMYGLAARERNARVLYIRPYLYDPSPESGFEQANERFMELLYQDLSRHMAPGAASPFSKAVQVDPVLAMVVAAGGMCVAWMLLELFLPIKDKWGVLAVAVIAGATGASCSLGSYGQLWRTLVALGCAGAVSLYAIVHLFDELERVGRRSSWSQIWWGSTAIWLRMTLWSLSGAILASSLLQETSFKLGLDTFRGVKLLTIGVPLLAVLAWLARRPASRRYDFKVLVTSLSTNIRLYHLIGFAVLAVVGLFYAVRTGNTGGDVGGEALEAERFVRMVLDQTLGVRPRFKEFLIAHPAMLLVPYLIRMGRIQWVWLLILAGATGQAGLPDTFAHIHTPLWVSLVRTLMGAFLGWCLCAPVYLILVWTTRRFVPPPRAGSGGHGHSSRSGSGPLKLVATEPTQTEPISN